MASDIAGSVTATYDTVVTAPDDGDAVNSAGLVTMMLGGLNRTEFLNAQLNTDPWINADIFEDFLFTDRETGSNTVLRSDTLWKLDEDIADNNSFTNLASSGPEVGVCRISQTSGFTSSVMLRKSTALGFRVVQTQRISFRVRFPSILAAQNAEIGIGNGSNTQVAPGASSDTFAVTLKIDNSGSWVLQTVNAGRSEVAVPASTMVAGVYMHLELIHDGVGGWTASADGGATVAAVANIPAGTEDVTLLMRYQSPAAGTRQMDLDFINARFLSAGRVI